MKKDNPVLLQDPVLNTIAEKHRRTPAQVTLRYQLQRGVAALAKSFNEKRLKENFQVPGRVLGSRELTEAHHFPRDELLGRLPMCIGAKLISLYILCVYVL